MCTAEFSNKIMGAKDNRGHNKKKLIERKNSLRIFYPSTLSFRFEGI